MLDINIRTLNVELSQEQKQQVYRHLGPLVRLVQNQRKVTCDVIIRNIRRPLTGALYCVMVRVRSPEELYYAVGMEHVFMRAIRAAETELRRTMSRSYNPDTKSIEHLRSHAHERFFVELFAA